MKKSNTKTYVMIIFLFIGLLVLFYPSLADYTNQKIQSKAIANYEKVISNIKKTDYSSYFDKAEKYNKSLVGLKNNLALYKKLGRTEEILNLDGKGMIGYLTIDKLKVELPIYYGTSAEVLNRNVGLLEGSSYPIGGIGTHAVLSAHRGLPSSKLFTDLDRLEEGDTFVVKVLDRTLTYEVDKISIVTPDELENLNIDAKSDYITLMTCTPYGINTHRLLVRGHRVENARIKQFVVTEAYKMSKLMVTPVVFIPILIIWLISIAVKPIEKNINWKLMFVYPTEYQKEEEKKKALKEKLRLELIEKKKNKNIKKGK